MRLFQAVLFAGAHPQKIMNFTKQFMAPLQTNDEEAIMYIDGLVLIKQLSRPLVTMGRKKRHL